MRVTPLNVGELIYMHTGQKWSFPLRKMLPHLKYRTDKRLKSFTTNEDGNYKKS